MVFVCDVVVVEFEVVSIVVSEGWLLLEFGVLWCGYCIVV